MKKIISYISIVVSVVALMSSCISSEETSYLQSLPKDYEVVKFEEYKLAVRDNISCKISVTDDEAKKMFGDIISDDLSRQSGLGLVIYEDSTVIIPFFGNIKVVGLTLQEAEQKIQDVMIESFPNAQVKLTLITNYFYIYANDRQGVYRVYKENMTIYQALAVSGQTTNRMDLSRVKIVRKGSDGSDTIKEFDLRSEDVVESEFYYIKPNDVIYFSTNKNSFFNVTSVQTFISMIMTPLTLFFLVINQTK